METRGRGRSQRQRKRGTASGNGREECFMEEKTRGRAFQAGGGLSKAGGGRTWRGSVEGGWEWTVKALSVPIRMLDSTPSPDQCHCPPHVDSISKNIMNVGTAICQLKDKRSNCWHLHRPDFFKKKSEIT